MSDDTEGTLTPKLRFPEFLKISSWSKTTLSSILTEHKLKSDGRSEVHSVSLSKGVVPQVEHMGRSFSASDTSHYNLAKPFDIIYTKSPLAIFKLGIVKQNHNRHNVIVSPLYGVFSPINEYVGQIIQAYFDSPSRNIRYLAPLTQKGAKNTIQITNQGFLSGAIYLPGDEREQQKIACCIASINELITAQEQKTEALKVYKQGLMQELFPLEGKIFPRRRFPEFTEASEWDEFEVGDLVTTVSPPKKLQTSLYMSEGRYQIVDQSPAPFCGWTDDANAVYSPDQPVIIFGDHTCTLKLRSSPFAQGADGIKILRSKSPVTSDFLFQVLQAQPLVSNEYKRHYSELQEKVVRIPRKETGEQQKLAETLTVLDNCITAQAQKLDALEIHKRGLMQCLFSSPEGIDA